MSCQKELKIGTMIERKEHKLSIATSRKIAKDHIREFSRYYTHPRYGLIITEKKYKRHLKSFKK